MAPDQDQDQDQDFGYDPEQEWSVDDLARRAGTTVRTVRLYQERGLLPPPRREGRRGLYSGAHLRRLKLVLSMLDRGYPLTAIRELTEAWEAHRSLGDVLGFEEVLTAPYSSERPRRLSLDELAELFPRATPNSLSRAVELGLIVPDGDGFLAPSPALVTTGAQLEAEGVPAAAVLDTAAVILASTDQLAERFVALFRDHIWQPFLAAGMPAEDLPRITEALQRMRPLAARAVGAALAQAMERHTEVAARAEATGLLVCAAAEPAEPYPAGA